MIEKTKKIDIKIDGKKAVAEIKVMNALEAEKTITDKPSNIEIVKMFCDSVNFEFNASLEKNTFKPDEFIYLPGSYKAVHDIAQAIIQFGWLGGDEKND